MARESMLTLARLELVGQDLSTHLRRMIFGEAGLAISAYRAAIRVGAAVAAVVAIGVLLGRDRSARMV